MKLFYNRRLALFCCIFIAVSVALYKLNIQYKIALSIASGVVLLLFALVAFITRKGSVSHVRSVFCAICALSVLAASVLQVVAIDLKRNDALECTGERYVSFIVVGEEYESEYSSEYIVLTESVDGEGKRFSSRVTCFFSDAFDVGDKIYAKAEIYPAVEYSAGNIGSTERDEYICISIYDSSNYAVISEGNRSPAILFGKLRSACSEYMDRVFGNEGAGLAKGFLLGDKSDISYEVMKDFRRAGISHLLCVSGLHISVIIGSLELFLRKLLIGRKTRCVVLSVAAFFLLAMTGFSMSACRCVIMLWIVYVSYIFVKESDSVTTLFSSVAFIMFIMPSSVTDIGLWLSFLATLGIVAVWQPLSLKIIAGSRAGLFGRVKYIAKKILLAVMMTFICNAFICIIVWYYFGEISTVSLLSNPILSPIASLYLMAVLICCAFSFISPLVDVTVLMGEMIEKAAEGFSRISGAVISLKYDFAPYIIVAMSLAIAVMLCIKLRRKWLMLIPPISAVIVFSICFGIYSINHSGELSLSYCSEKKNEAIVVTKGYSAAICDFSYGSYPFLSSVCGTASDSYATEISDYLLTHYHARHTGAIDKLLRSHVVRRICLPCPKNAEEVSILNSIAELASEKGVELLLYESGEYVEILDTGWCSFLLEEETDPGEHRALCAVIGNEDEALVYVSSNAHQSSIADSALSIVERCEYVIFGKHGPIPRERYSYEISGECECIFYSEYELYSLSDIERGSYALCVPKDDKYTLFDIVLH